MPYIILINAYPAWYDIYTVRGLYYRACRQGTVWLQGEEEHPVDSLTDLMHPQLCTLECTFTFSAGDRLNKIFD